MRLGRRTKIGAVLAIALLIGVPYSVYAMQYRGEYEVSVSMFVNYVRTGEVSVTELEVVSEPMDMMSFFDVLKSHNKAAIRANYSVFAELNCSGDDMRTETTYLIVTLDSSVPVSLTFYEVPPGTAQLRVYVVWNLLDQTVYDYTKSVVIG